MKFFKSLECCLCRSPFAPIANDPRSPRAIDCGKAMCHECFEAEKVLNKEERKHQCARKDCFSNPNFAYSLIDIISTSSLVHVPIRNGYLLAESFTLPECPICHEEYSTEGQNVPFYLHCRHNLCKGCYEKCRKPNEEEKKEQFPFRVICAKCRSPSITSNGNLVDKQIIEFLKELPKMTRQLEEMENSEYRFCGDCKSLICGLCAFEKHKMAEHQVGKLLEKEALDLSSTIKESSMQDIAAYEGVFPELHLKLADNIKDFQKKLTSKEELLSNKRTFKTLRKCYNKCKRLKTDFESFSEDYLPNLRKYNAQVEGLIAELGKEPD